MGNHYITPKTDRAVAIETLRKDYGLKAGSTVSTSVLHVSRTGMTRVIGLYIGGKNGTVLNIGWLAAAAMGAKWDRERGGVVMEGAGMDMTFAAVYALSRSLFPNGHRCTAQDSGPRRCPSNDHNNDWMVARQAARNELGEDADHAALRERTEEITQRDGLTHRRGRLHRDGGYALTRTSL